MLCLDVSLLVSLGLACSSSNVQRNRASDGPPTYVCNSDEFRGWQIGHYLEAQLSV